MEKTVYAPGRAEKIKELRNLIDKEGVQYIYFQHISVTGRIVGKGATSKIFEQICEKGYQLVYGSVANLFMDRYGNYIGFGAEESELAGIPELDTFRILPWEGRVARVYCDCFDTETGAFFDADCRGNLKRTVEKATKELGGAFICGIEPEMMWLKQQSNGELKGMSKPWCYHIGQFEELRPIYLDVIAYAQQMGIDMIYGDHEDAPGQLELNFKPARAIDTADILTSYRQICAEVGRKHEVIPCFMPKPFLGVSANGHHHHFSMVDKDGGMLFYDPNGPAKLSEFGRYFIGGILQHADALCALTASTVNSYKRFWDAGFWAPLYKDYGWQNRTTVVRVAAPGRFEYRAVDSAVNPYLSLPALLLAGLDGVKNKIDPGPERRENVYTIFGREKHMGEAQKGAEHIPLSLGEALEALKKDAVIQEALPGRMYRVFMHYKSDEWERYLSQVTEWERETYLRVLP